MLAKNLPGNEWWKILFRIMLDDISALKGLLSGDGGYFLAIKRAHFSFIHWLFFKRKEHCRPTRKKVLLRGLYHGNIAWQHFVRKKEKFSEIVKDE